MKKYFVLLILIVGIGVGTLVGCSSKKDDTSVNTDTTTTGATEANATTDAAADTQKHEDIVITMMRSGAASSDTEDFETVTLPRLVNEKFPWITVEFERYPDEQYRTTLKSKLASGEGPNLYSWWPKSEMDPIVQAGYAKDVTGASFFRNLNPSLTESFAKEGVVYGIPEGMNILGTYYNKNMFEELGIAIPTNWDELLAACEKIKAAGKTPIAMADKDMWYMQFSLYQIAANVVYSNDMDFDVKLIAGEKKFTDPVWVDSLDKFISLYKLGYVQENSLGAGGAQASQLFVDGEAAMIFDGGFNADNNIKAGAADFERGFFALPANDSSYETYLSAAPAAGYIINADVDEATYEALTQVLEYWFEEGSPLYEAWKTANGTTILAHNAYVSTNPMFADYIAMLKTNKSIYFCNQAWPEGVADAMESALQEVIAGKDTTSLDVAEAMEAKLRELQEQQGN